GHAINRLIKGGRTIPQLVVLLGIVGGTFILLGPNFEMIFAVLMLAYIVAGLLFSLRDFWVARFGRKSGRLHALKPEPASGLGDAATSRIED
ncbi:MAG: hypothetical protein KDB07_04060, partial [Planctomycetes bacterium]|nr:hypothetical protein [Planctomycetota bacterium]